MSKHSDRRVAFFGKTPIGIPGQHFNNFPIEFDELDDNGVLEPVYSDTGGLWSPFGQASSTQTAVRAIAARASEVLNTKQFRDEKVMLMTACLGHFDKEFRQTSLDKRLAWLESAAQTTMTGSKFSQAVEFTERLHTEIHNQLKDFGGGFFSYNVASMRFPVAQRRYKSLYVRIAKLRTLYSDTHEFLGRLSGTLNFLGFDLSFRPDFKGFRVQSFLGSTAISNVDLIHPEESSEINPLIQAKRQYDSELRFPYETSVVIDSAGVNEKLLRFESNSFLLVLSNYSFEKYVFIRINNLALETVSYTAKPIEKRVSKILDAGWEKTKISNFLKSDSEIDIQKLTDFLGKKFSSYLGS
jgi:hypothetical protein